MCCSRLTGKLLKAGCTNPIFPSVIPSCTSLCSGKGPILTDYANVKQLWGHLRDSSTIFWSVCGFRALSLIKMSSGVLMKNLFFGGGGAVTIWEKPWKSINRRFLADEISGVTFKGVLFKRSHVRCLTTDNGTSCQSCKWHLGLSGSDCAFRRALCWLKRRGQAINDIRAASFKFSPIKNRSEWSDVVMPATLFPSWPFFLIIQGLNCFRLICVNRTIDTRSCEWRLFTRPSRSPGK